MWVKSSSSNGNGGNNCVEVAATVHGVAVRNSRFPNGTMLFFTEAEWREFLAGADRGEFAIEALPR
jgi:hypothetical protein